MLYLGRPSHFRVIRLVFTVPALITALVTPAVYGQASSNITLRSGQQQTITFASSSSAAPEVAPASIEGGQPELLTSSKDSPNPPETLPEAPVSQFDPQLDLQIAADQNRQVSAFQSGPPPARRTPRFAPLPLAPLYNKYIEPGQTAQPLLGVQRKMLFGLDQIVSPYFFLAVVASAGYEQATNGSPNFGTDIGAYGQRVGAAAIRSASQEVFTDGLMPVVFHQDPRYYVKGKSHSALARGTYAVSRVFVTRTDSGENAPNYSLFAGHAATAILQNAYYPSDNQGATETLKNFGGSLAGAALSNAVREFLPDILHVVHLE